MLSQVHGSTEQEIREMSDEQANPQNAVVRESVCMCVCLRARVRACVRVCQCQP